MYSLLDISVLRVALKLLQGGDSLLVIVRSFDYCGDTVKKTIIKGLIVGIF